MGERLGVHPLSCHGWVLGEHGDSSGKHNLFLLFVAKGVCKNFPAISLSN
jgi:hypothetical protein